MRLNADRSTIVVGGSLGLVILLVLYCVLHFWFLRQEFVNEIEAIQPKTSRILGMLERYEDLERAGTMARGSLQSQAYTADRDSATTAAAMQQNIRELMITAGLSVSGSQILPARKDEGFDRLSLDISAEGNIDALDDALSGLEDMRPLVFVESVKIKPVRSRPTRKRRGEPEVILEGDPRKLTAQFHLFSLRLQD